MKQLLASQTSLKAKTEIVKTESEISSKSDDEDDDDDSGSGDDAVFPRGSPM